MHCGRILILCTIQRIHNILSGNLHSGIIYFAVFVYPCKSAVISQDKVKLTVIIRNRIIIGQGRIRADRPIWLQRQQMNIHMIQSITRALIIRTDRIPGCDGRTGLGNIQCSAVILGGICILHILPSLVIFNAVRIQHITEGTAIDSEVDWCKISVLRDTELLNLSIGFCILIRSYLGSIIDQLIDLRIVHTSIVAVTLAVENASDAIVRSSDRVCKACQRDIKVSVLFLLAEGCSIRSCGHINRKSRLRKLIANHVCHVLITAGIEKIQVYLTNLHIRIRICLCFTGRLCCCLGGVALRLNSAACHGRCRHRCT